MLELEAARSEAEHLPRAALSLSLAPGDFAVIETLGPRRGAAFAGLCSGLAPLVAGRVRFLGRDWAAMPAEHADALRGQIGRLFHAPLRDDTPDVAERVILKRLHHTLLPREAVLDEAARLARRFGLPGLPIGPARAMNEFDLLRAAFVRAFLGQPRLLILELSPLAQDAAMIETLLSVGAEARGEGACVVWLAVGGQQLRGRSIRPTHRLRLGDAGLTAVSRPVAVPA